MIEAVPEELVDFAPIRFSVDFPEIDDVAIWDIMREKEMDGICVEYHIHAQPFYAYSDDESRLLSRSNV